MKLTDRDVADIQANPGWQRILASFARFVQPAAGQHVLDIGCGAGALVAILRREFDATVWGLDVVPALLKMAHQHVPEAAFITGSVYQLPLPTASLDGITATNVLYLLAEPHAAVQEIARVLKPGGWFAMLNPAPQMSVPAATALADARQLDETARAHLVRWARVAEAHPRWSVADVRALLAPASLGGLQTRHRVGDGLALYARATRQN